MRTPYAQHYGRAEVANRTPVRLPDLSEGSGTPGDIGGDAAAADATPTTGCEWGVWV